MRLDLLAYKLRWAIIKTARDESRCPCECGLAILNTPQRRVLPCRADARAQERHVCRKQRTTGQPKATPRRLNSYTLLLTLAAVPRLVLLVLAPEAERPPFVFVALRASLDYFFGTLLPAPQLVPVR